MFQILVGLFAGLVSRYLRDKLLLTVVYVISLLGTLINTVLVLPKLHIFGIGELQEMYKIFQSIISTIISVMPQLR